VFIDVDCFQLSKHNQNAFGDYFVVRRKAEEERLIAVLSDGLGSGIKASILATMTATMLLRFVEEDVDIRNAAEIMMNSLPVCKVRRISYATFSVVDCDEDGNVRVVEEGNPDFVWLRGPEALEAPCRVVASRSFPDRQLKFYNFKVQLGDRLVFCSDGVTQAGLGKKKFKFGLRRSGLIDILRSEIADEPELSSSALVRRIVGAAKAADPDGLPRDDISACVVYFRNPRQSMIFTGAPFDDALDSYYVDMFAAFAGKKAICGGTTANIISREMGRAVTTTEVRPPGGLPAAGTMEGVDLVTEGILTLTKVVEYLEKDAPGQSFHGVQHRDAARQLIDFMLDSDEIAIMMGVRPNQAHYDPTLPVEIEIRRNVIQKIKQLMENKYFKKVNIQSI
jgi:serine/threonine protein phosphatase PrpC